MLRLGLVLGLKSGLVLGLGLGLERDRGTRDIRREREGY